MKSIVTFVATLLIGCSGATNPSTPSAEEDSELQVRSAFITCTPRTLNHSLLDEPFGFALDKYYVLRNSRGQFKLVIETLRGHNAPKNETWVAYDSAPICTASKTPTKIEAQLGDDVTWNIDATWDDATSKYVGTIRASEDDEVTHVTCE